MAGIEWKEWREKTAAVKQSIFGSDKYFNLSAYPRTTRMYGHEPAEIFAEAFTAYVKGERLETLPQSVVDFFKEYWK